MKIIVCYLTAEHSAWQSSSREVQREMLALAVDNNCAVHS